MASNSSFDTAALAMVSELEKAAICDVVKELVAQEISVSAPEEFWQQVSASLSACHFTRSPAEAKFIYNACHHDNKALPDVKTFVRNQKRQVERQREGMERVEWPQAPPDPMATDEQALNEQLAAQAMAAFRQAGEQKQEGESGEGEEMKWEMTMALLGRPKDGGK